MDKTFWNGRPCRARIIHVIVGKALRPTWWCANLEGRVRKAVEVTQHGQTFFLDNEDGSGWLKVTVGKGMPNFGHSSLPSDSKTVESIIAYETQKRSSDWIAFIRDHLEMWEAGRTEAEAIEKLLVSRAPK